jgi:hypothetical protein
MKQVVWYKGRVVPIQHAFRLVGDWEGSPYVAEQVSVCGKGRKNREQLFASPFPLEDVEMCPFCKKRTQLRYYEGF